MKIIVYILFYFTPFFIFSQNQEKDSLILFEKFVDVKGLNSGYIYDNNEKIFLDKDTLVLINYTYTQSKIKLFSLPKSLYPRYYESIVFGSSVYDSNTIQNLKQWNIPLTIYIDKSIPRKVREKTKAFITKISNLNIKNLDLHSTNNIEKANYLIKTSNNILKKYPDNYLSKKEKENTPLNDIDYYMKINNSDKIYACELKINLNTFANDEKAFIELKKTFFSSLARFTQLSYLPKNSLLSKKYINSNNISQFDINLLKTHYNSIYQFKINYKLYKQLETLAKE